MPWFAQATLNEKTLSSNLTDAVNVTTVFDINILKDIIAISIDNVEQSYTLNGDGTATIASAQIDSGNNILTISYRSISEANCSLGMRGILIVLQIVLALVVITIAIGGFYMYKNGKLSDIKTDYQTFIKAAVVVIIFATLYLSLMSYIGGLCGG